MNTMAKVSIWLILPFQIFAVAYMTAGFLYYTVASQPGWMIYYLFLLFVNIKFLTIARRYTKELNKDVDYHEE